MKRVLSSVMIILLLTGIVALVNIPFVKATGTIYIRADGSIDPSSAPISRTGDLYTLTGNITGYAGGSMLRIERDNIIVDGTGYTLHAPGFYKSGMPLYYGITLFARNNVTVRNANIEAFEAVGLSGCSNISIIGNKVTNSEYGITLFNSSYSVITGNTLTNNSISIDLADSCNNSIFANTITTNYVVGIWLKHFSDGNSISDNTLSSNWVSIEIQDCSVNSIVRNTIAYSRGVGIEFSTELFYGYENCGDNSIYHNNFVNNTHQVFPFLGARGMWEVPWEFWDDGYPSGGNYWSDYNGTDSDLDGLGDSPYILGYYDSDNHPLMNPYLQGDVNRDIVVDVFDCILVVIAFGSTPSSLTWDIRRDMNRDNAIDMLDLVVVALHFGETG